VDDIYNGNDINKIISYLHISIYREEMEVVAREEDIKNHINDNVKITQMKKDPLSDNFQFSNEDFYKFLNEGERLYNTFLFRKNTVLDNVVKNANIVINSTKNNKKYKEKQEIMCCSKNNK
jgi:hypothetical protein